MCYILIIFCKICVQLHVCVVVVYLFLAQKADHFKTLTYHTILFPQKSIIQFKMLMFVVHLDCSRLICQAQFSMLLRCTILI